MKSLWEQFEIKNVSKQTASPASSRQNFQLFKNNWIILPISRSSMQAWEFVISDLQIFYSDTPEKNQLRHWQAIIFLLNNIFA